MRNLRHAQRWNEQDLLPGIAITFVTKSHFLAAARQQALDGVEERTERVPATGRASHVHSQQQRAFENKDLRLKQPVVFALPDGLADTICSSWKIADFVVDEQGAAQARRVARLQGRHAHRHDGARVSENLSDKARRRKTLRGSGQTARS